MTDEVKVGAFFVIAVVLVTAVVLFVGDYMGVWASTIVTVHFRNTAGLQSGAEVRLSGVRVGRVLRVRLEDNPEFPKRNAAVRIALDPDVRAYAGDDFYIEQGALIGDKYVSIVRTEARKKRLLKDGEHIAGAGLSGLSGIPYETEQLIDRAKKTMQSVEETFMGMQRKEQIDQIMRNVISLTARADQVSIEALQFAGNLSKMSTDVGPQVREMSRNLQAASASVSESARLVQQTVERSPVSANATKASENLVRASENVEDATQRIALLLDDPQLAVRLENALANMDAATQNLAATTQKADRLISDDQGIGSDVKVAMRNLRQASADLAATSSHIREVVTDEQMTEDIKATVGTTRKTLEEAEQVTQKASASLNRVNRTMDRVSEAVSSVSPGDVEASVAVQAATQRSWRADFNADLYYGRPPRANDFWRLGVYDAGDSERLNLQKAIPTGSNSRIRFGIKAGQPAVGYDRMFSHAWGTEIDLWDPGEKRVDILFDYNIGPDSDLIFGGNDVFSDRDFFMGYRYYLNPLEQDFEDNTDE